MKRTTLLTIAYFAFVYLSNSQGSIDIDTNIQMGIAGMEHVKITNTNFSIHQDAANPLIYGDFVSGNVGIGTNNPLFPFHVSGAGFGSHLSIETDMGGAGRPSVVPGWEWI